MFYSHAKRGSSQARPRNARPANRFAGSHIAPSRYINAAVELADEPQFVAQHTFTDFGLSTPLLNNVLRHGYDTPTPIQDQAIIPLLQGQDVVGIANTGTGKTAAFLLPMINKVLLDDKQGVLILAPTRELALQILEEFKAFASRLPVSVCLCIGGANIEQQIRQLKHNPHFVIGTPGRIKDLLNRRVFNPELFTNIVLDEVDRMLDIGFRKDILFLISQLPSKRQAALFSATLNRETDEIIHSFLNNPVTITIKKQETAATIQQDIVEIAAGQSKVDVLHQLLTQPEFERVIVFGRTKHGINKLEKMLCARGLRVGAIHGNKTQGARLRSLQDFKQGRTQALLATDVAARGIDIDDVTHVINYDEPQCYEDYVHRIGRTGRAGKAGKALTFISR